MVRVPYPCIVCKLEVRPRQQALQCDGCQQWQNRKCYSGISQVEYRAAVHNCIDIDWQCHKCKPAILLQQFINEVPVFDPLADSTHVSELAAAAATASITNHTSIADHTSFAKIKFDVKLCHMFFFFLHKFH